MKTTRTDIEKTIVSFLDKSIDDVSSARLLEWLEASASNRKIFLDCYNTWCAAEAVTGAADSDAEFTAFISRISREEKLRSRRLWRYATASAVAAVVVLAGVFTFVPKAESADDIMNVANELMTKSDNPNICLTLAENNVVEIAGKSGEIVYDSTNITFPGGKSALASSSYNQLTVPNGHHTTLRFADGSSVWVSPGTRLVYPAHFSSDQREIFVDGEVFLNVAHNPEWPFVVRTQKLDVNVLGTEFFVSTLDSTEKTEVALVSGSVRITTHDNEKDVLLKPDQRYTLSDQISVENVNTDKYVLLTKGILLMESTPLNEITECLERFYNQKIACSPSAASLCCSGKLNLNDGLNKVLEILCKTAPIIYLEKLKEEGVIKIEALNT